MYRLPLIAVLALILPTSTKAQEAMSPTENTVRKYLSADVNDLQHTIQAIYERRAATAAGNVQGATAIRQSASGLVKVATAQRDALLEAFPTLDKPTAAALQAEVQSRLADAQSRQPSGNVTGLVKFEIGLWTSLTEPLALAAEGKLPPATALAPSRSTQQTGAPSRSVPQTGVPSGNRPAVPTTATAPPVGRQR